MNVKYLLYYVIGISITFFSVYNLRTSEEEKPLFVSQMVINDTIRTFLTISDIHLDIDADTIKKEGHNWSDTDQKLWAYTKDKLEALIDKKDSLRIDFMLFTGDLPYHGWNDRKRAKNIGKVLSYLSQLSETSGIPLLFVPGNNDSLDGDYKSFRDKQDKAPFVTDSNFANEWPFIMNKGACDSAVSSSCYIDSSQVYGYYSAYPLANQKLRFIGLNTVIHNNRKNSLCYNPPSDGAKQAKAAQIQMDWFVQQMDSVSSKNEKVIIAMHIPPGTDGYGGNPLWADFVTSSGETIQNEFIRSISEKRNNVVGIFTGHTHMDEVRLIYNHKSQFTNLCISTPGITPQHANNPGFKLVTYNNRTYELMDFKTYYSDFFKRNRVVPFTKEYTFNNAYHNFDNQGILSRMKEIEKDSFGIVITGMQSTYKVGKKHWLSHDEIQSMKMKYDENAVPITKSGCN